MNGIIVRLMAVEQLQGLLHKMINIWVCHFLHCLFCFVLLPNASLEARLSAEIIRTAVALGDARAPAMKSSAKCKYFHQGNLKPLETWFTLFTILTNVSNRMLWLQVMAAIADPGGPPTAIKQAWGLVCWQRYSRRIPRSPLSILLLPSQIFFKTVAAYGVVYKKREMWILESVLATVVASKFFKRTPNVQNAGMRYAVLSWGHAQGPVHERNRQRFRMH